MEGKIKTRGRRLLVLFAVLLAVTALMCVSAFAADVASITNGEGTTNYTTLKDAFDHAVDGDTVVLLSDVTVSGEVGVSNKAITVDGTGTGGNYTIYLAADPDASKNQFTCLFAGDNGGITFRNVTITSAAGVESHVYAAVRVYNGGNITLDTGAVIKDYVAGNGGALFCDVNGSTIVMNAGSKIENCKSNWRAPVAVDNGTFTMNGGTITGCQSTSGDKPSAVLVQGNGAAELKGGEIKANGQTTGGRGAVVVTKDGTITVGAGMTIAGNAVADVLVDRSGENTASISLAEGALSANACVEGTDFTAYFDTATYKAAVGRVGYATLDEAVSSAASGSTVYVLANTTLNGCEIDKTLTIDGMGKTVRVKNADDIDDKGETNSIRINANGDVTLRNVTITRTDKNAYFAVLRINGGKVTLGSGTTISNVSGGNGSAIYMAQYGDKGVVNMEDGSLIDSCYSGVLGSDCLNWGWSSIGLEGGTFNMNGGKITGCVAPNSSVPSAIWLRTANVKVNLNGGTITGNSGGVGAIGADAGTLNVYAGANVTNNGGINIKKMKDTAKINVVDGIVTGNLSAADTLWVDDKYVAVAGTSLYDEVWKAVYNGFSGSSTVYLLKDAEFKTPSAEEVTAEETATGVDISSGTALDRSQNLVFDGQGHTLYMTGAKTCSATLTFRNVTMDISGVTNNDGAFRWWGGTLTFGNGCTVVGKEYTEKATPGGYLLYLGGGTVNIEEGCVIRDNKRFATDAVNGGAIHMEGGTLNMTGGLITGCRATEGGAIRVLKGTFNMTGGEITGNLSWSGSGIRAYEGAVLNISGDAKVYGNFEGTTSAATNPDNIRANTGTSLNIDKAFTGKLGFKLNKLDTNVLNTKIGTIAAGLTLASDSIVCDTDPTLFAYASNGELILTARPVLTAVTDMGRYTLTGDPTVYGVVRVNTTVNKPSDVVEEIGTYFYTVRNDGLKDASAENGANYVKFTDMTKLVEGNGYTADVVKITENATIYAVNFYKHKTLGYLFESPVEINFVKKQAKYLGNDPVELIYE